MLCGNGNRFNWVISSQKKTPNVWLVAKQRTKYFNWIERNMHICWCNGKPRHGYMSEWGSHADANYLNEFQEFTWLIYFEINEVQQRGVVGVDGCMHGLLHATLAILWAPFTSKIDFMTFPSQLCDIYVSNRREQRFFQINWTFR